jgi:long-chain fatty acid transport protein
MIRKTLSGAVIALSLTGASTALATNGMNLEGYGAKSHAMGGAGMAYDTGNSAVMNNPATLGMMKEGTEEIGLGIRGMHPEVQADYGAYTDHSSATAFYMPSFSYIRRDGDFTWGAAVLSQGGMGADYGDDSPLFAGWFRDPSNPNSFVPMSSEGIRSEVGVGRVMFPIAYNLTDNTAIGGSVDFVWASMDIQMDMDGYHFGQMETGGSMLSVINPSPQTLDYIRYDFSNDTPFIGKAVGYGSGFKLGFTHKVSKLLTIGGTYHSQTMLSDLESNNAQITVVNGSGAKDVSGKIKVNDFEWPATFAAGIALHPSDRLMVAADVKFVDWSTVMDKFSTTFIADDEASNGDYAGQTLDMSMKQDWKDQTVYSVGVEYKASDNLALRGGASFSNNPVPDTYLHPLFPAIIKNHYTCGFGYRLSESTRMGMAYSWAPRLPKPTETVWSSATASRTGR